MRDILFRGKRVDNGETVEGFYIFDGFNHYIVKFYTDENAEGTLYPVQEAFEVIPETVGQFTGLTDKNGKRVFEGDMVVSYNISGYEDDCGIVNWNDFFVAWHFGKNSMYSRIATYEVIGNIHANPEMLEATQNGT